MSEPISNQSILVKKADRFVHDVYKVSRQFPKEELYGITSQLRRSALSIVLNAIEGFARQNTNEHRRFLDISYGSLKETKYLLYFCFSEGYIEKIQYDDLYNSCDELGKILWSLIQTLKQK